MMTENPYKPPQISDETKNAQSSLRNRARQSLRIATVVLLIPAIYNYWAFDAHTIASGRLPGDLVSLYRTLNVLGFIVGSTFIWLLGVPSLEAIGQLVRIVFAHGTDKTAWQGVLYRSLNWTAVLAIPGAALWVIWVFAFYQMNVDFYTISWAVGIPAHLLAASLYLPLIYGWYRVAASRSTRQVAQN